MALSDAERRTIDEIEEALLREDPRFASSVSGERFQQLRRRWIVLPTLLFVLGAVMLVAGLVATHAVLVAGAIVAVVGFAAMPTAILLFLRHRPAAQSHTTTGDPA